MDLFNERSIFEVIPDFSSFFEDQKEEDDVLSESVTLSLVNGFEQRTSSINTTWLILLEIVLLIAMWVSSFLIPVLCGEDACHQSPFAFLIYIAGGVWFVQLLIDRYYRHQHYRSRLCGYLNFYRRTRNIRRLPLLLASAANACLLIVSQVTAEECADTPDECGFMKHREGYLQIIISISCALQIILLIIYSIRTIQFNKSGASPDVNQEEMSTSFLQTNAELSDIGFRDENLTDEVLERQADMIRYLKHHSTQLGKHILTLSEENQALKQGR